MGLISLSQELRCSRLLMKSLFSRVIRIEFNGEYLHMPDGRRQVDFILDTIK